MNLADHTQAQSDDDRERAQQLSLEERRPPREVPGYEIQRFLGAGAYGEVWVAIDHNTGRPVAIKFYTHRGGLDWSLLSREVEKLVYLTADRYVVQLMEVGWDATPPYYVMEFIEHGSLEDHLQTRGSLPVSDALDLFREIAVGLSHAHTKGVLHCDLKPANILLDQDAKPRLADFGQSRLSTDQSPSLGTLFYMAPEQANLEAVPDARWDVYALGAILYCALVGRPPHRTEDNLQRINQADGLEERLSIYRSIIENASAPSQHRKLPGMDNALATLIDRCLAANPAERLPSVQDVLTGLEQRESQRQRRPVLLLGFLGPLLLLTVMSLFGWRSYHQATVGREAEIRQFGADVNTYAARMVANKATIEISRYYAAVEQLANSDDLQQMLQPLISSSASPEVKQLLDTLSDPHLNTKPIPARATFIEHPARQPLQEKVREQMAQHPVASWFVCDARGTQLASTFSASDFSSTIGQNYRWRTYFHGGPEDLVERDDNGVPTYGSPDKPLEEIHLSAAFLSNATNRWKVAISAPVLARDTKQLIAVVALTVDIRVFLRFEDNTENFFAVLLDGRSGKRQGLVLQHPIYEQLDDGGRLPDSFTDYRMEVFGDRQVHVITDPFGSNDLGKMYERPWLAAQATVLQNVAQGPRNTGLIIQVQQDYNHLVKPVRQLSRAFLRLGLLSLGAFAAIVASLWLIVLRVSQSPSATIFRPGGATTQTPVREMTTLYDRRR